MKRKTEKNNQSRKWYLIDGKDRVLGRLAAEVVNLLRGKNKPSFSPHLDLGDYVIITNASLIKVTGKKMDQKIYYHHTGYPGGLRKKTLKELFKEKPEEVLKKAIEGMLPKNKLRKFWLKRLYIYPKTEHPHQDKKLEVYKL